MNFRLTYVERRDPETSSVERVFARIGAVLRSQGIEVNFEKLPYGNDALGMLKSGLFYRPSRSDIYHITGQIHHIALFLPRDKTILTIHDLGVLRFRTGIRRWLIRKFLFELPAKRVKYLTVSSENTKRDLIEQTDCPVEKIRVVELPLPRQMSGDYKPLEPLNPTILQIGTAPNKNLRRVVLALENIPCTLRIIGNIPAAELQLLKDKQVTFVNRVGISDEEMTGEYRQADIVLFCSTFEGFGLPVIEAQAMNTPVITSNLSPMRDIAGDGALLIDPTDTAEIRAAVLSIIDDPGLALNLVQRGSANVRRYSPEKISKDFASLYEEVISSNRKAVQLSGTTAAG